MDFDKNGEIASTGKINMDIINQFIEHDIYSSKDRHSYDRNEFDFNFIKGLIFEDAVATLNYFTALIISNYLNDNFFKESVGVKELFSRNSTNISALLCLKSL